MPTTPLPAIGTISDPTKVRVALMQGNQAVNGPPLSVVAAAVGVPSGGTTGQVLTKSTDADYDSGWADIPTQGDLSGPASAVDGNFAAFDGTTGKLVKDSGKKASDFATAADLATVATSGAYDDLSGKPTLREVLTADRTYYVRTDGSDSNDGLSNASGGAFLTIQKAVDTIGGTLDIGANKVTIQVTSGTYTGAVTVTGPWVGTGDVELTGDTTTPSNCTLSVAGTALTVQSGGRLLMKGMKLTNSVGRTVIIASFGYLKLSGKNEFGVAAGHRFSVDSGRLDANSEELISGNSGGAHYLAINNGIIYCQSAVWTATTSVSVGAAFASASTGTIYAFANSKSGTVTGARYSATLNGVINTNGGGASVFPGSSAGSTATGGQYA